jgi:endonuclease III
VAPVDELGCDQLSYESKKTNNAAYHKLIGLMLSPQTKDEITHTTLRYLIEEK